MLPYEPAAVISTDSVLSIFTYAPIFVATVLLASLTVTDEMDGTIAGGTFSVSAQVLVPVSTPPL